MSVALTPEAELERLFDNSVASFVEGIEALIAAEVTENQGARSRAVSSLARLYSQNNQLSDLVGRRRAVIETEAARDTAGGEPTSVQFRDQGRLILHYQDPPPILPRTPFAEALRDLVSRTPVFKENLTAELVAVVYGEQHGFALALSTSAIVTERVQSFLAESRRRGIIARDAIETIAAMGDFTRGYAATVYRTNLNTAYTAGRFQQAADPDIAEIMKAFEYDAIRDSRVRRGVASNENHLALDGMIAPTQWSGWSTYASPNGYNSLAPDTRVSGSFEAASKAWYSGPLVKIKTVNGRRLSVTVNHPVLTRSGFVRAGDIRKGHDLIQHLPSVKSLVSGSRDDAVAFPFVRRRAEHKEQMPPRIEDVYKAASSQRAGASLVDTPRTGPLDFHGDARFYKGDVNIVTMDGMLPPVTESAALESPTDSLFVLGSGTAAATSHSASVLEGSDLVGLGVAANLNASVDQSTDDSRARGVKLLRELEHGFASEILFDNVIDVEVVSYSGHVYDLQSPNGWIVADGLFVSNCRCTMRLRSKFSLEREGFFVDGAVRLRVPSNLSASWVHVNFRSRPDAGIYGTAGV